MGKINKFKFEYWNNLFLLSFLIYLFISISEINVLKSSTLDINNLIVSIFGNLNYNSKDILINSSNYIFNFLIITYLCCDYIKKDFNKNAIYIFTRTDKKSKWVNNKLLNLIFFICFYYIIQIMFVTLIALFMGFNIYNIYKFIFLIFCILLNLTTTALIISLISNIISFKLNGLLGYTISQCIFSICILSSYTLNLFNISETYLRFIPFINSITSWYSSFNSFLDRNLTNLTFYIENHIFIFNVLINILVIFILQIIIKKIVKEIDII